MLVRLRLLILLLLSSISMLAQNPGDNLFDNSYLHEVKIYFENPNFWQLLIQDYDDAYANDTDIPYRKALQVYIDGVLLDTVGVRHKGFSSNFAANYYKKSLKLDFDEFKEGQTFDGLKKINLNNGVGDPGYQRDFLCYDMIRTTGAPAPRVSHAKLYINDEYWGLYVLVEQVDKTFLANHFDDNDGNLFKNMGWSNLEWLGTNPDNYKDIFELKTNEAEDDWSGFINLCNIINNSSNANFPTQIQQVFNVPDYLKILAIDIMTDNWDSYIDHGRNFYLYEEPNGGKFNWIPWDYNLAMGGDFSTAGNPQVFDPICEGYTEFDYAFGADQEVAFTDLSTEDPDSWFWDFGDGNSSLEQNPVYLYPVEDIYTVCLTTTKAYPDTICMKKACHQIDLTIDLSGCFTLINGTCPHAPNDPALAEVMAIFPSCCDTEWDGFCEEIYEFISQGQSGSGGPNPPFNFPLVLENPEKRLIHRLMNLGEFRDLFLEYCCQILENNFTAERLFPLIDAQANLIRDAVYTDPNYLFSNNYFEYDVGYGGAANGGAIPQLKMYIENRIPVLQQDLDNTNHDCSPDSSPIGPMDVVINELVADNDSTSTINDPAGEFDDWIELYNNTNTTVDLSGFYLSDDENEPYKWAFPLGAKINAGGYLIVWADKQGAQSGLHANFKLSKDGEAVKLIHSDATIIDAVIFGEQTTNKGYARIPNGTGEFVIQNSTFNANNENLVDNEEIFSGNWRIFPNPADEVIHIRFPGELNLEQVTIGLYNQLGQLIQPFQQYNYVGSQLTLPIADLPAGLYRLAMRNGDGGVETVSVMVR
jgi:PKD repeat protein